MNCHETNKKNHKGHNPLKHMLHMILCCGLPMLIVGFLPLITKLNPSAGSFIGKMVPFLCPIMMVFMIFSMMNSKKEKSCCNITKEDINTKEIV